MRRLVWIMFLFLAFGMTGCAGPKITLFSDAADPLEEMTLSGTAEEKILVIPISGVIKDAPRSRFMRTMPSVVQEVVSHLQKAEKDDRVKAVLLKIDSPGGTITASDILYHELLSFKQRTGKKLLVCMMNVAASGGYYISLPADVIMAHPTTITGSVGVILMRPQVSGLMEKMGVAVRVNKSGENKDMGSPFRSVTPEEEKLMQAMIDLLARRFTGLVKKHRNLSDVQMTTVADARIFMAEEAVSVGLVDKVGYLTDAIDEAKTIARLDDDAKVVIYRRTEYADDNLYNTLSSGTDVDPVALVNLGCIENWFALEPGFYYLWPQVVGTP